MQGEVYEARIRKREDFICLAAEAQALVYLDLDQLRWLRG